MDEDFQMEDTGSPSLRAATTSRARGLGPHRREAAAALASPNHGPGGHALQRRLLRPVTQVLQQYSSSTPLRRRKKKERKTMG